MIGEEVVVQRRYYDFFFVAVKDTLAIYSLIGDCKEDRVDFKKWTLHFLNHIYEYGSDYHKRFCPITTS